MQTWKAALIISAIRIIDYSVMHHKDDQFKPAVNAQLVENARNVMLHLLNAYR